MTIYTSHGLACLQDQDYAAIALAMQVDAIAIDAALDGISDSFDTHYTHPYMLAITTATQGPFATSSEAVQGVPSWTVSTTNMVTSGASAGIRVTIPLSGWYSHGCYLNMVASGAITAASRRTSFARATRVTSGSTAVLSQVTWRTIDTNTAGEFLTSSGGTFYATAGSTILIEAYFSHSNAASGVNIVAPARIWCHYIGSGVEIGSA